MRLNIAPVNHESLNCQEVLLLSVAEWWEREHVLMYSESWGFSYRPYEAEHPEIFGKRFGSNDTNWRSNLARYHGIQTSDWRSDKTAAEIIRLAEEELAQQRPVAIIMDYFWCPWHEHFYQKFHGGAGGLPHTCMIVGIEEGQLICIDPMFSPEQVVLPFDHFEAGCGGYMKVSLADEPQWPHWREVVAQGLAHLGEQESNAFQQMRQFADDMEKHLDLRFESEGFEKKPGFSPIIFKLKLVGFGRKKFSLLLTELGKRDGVQALLDFAAKLEECANRWDRISVHLMKAFYSKKPAGTLAKVVDLIRSSADVEGEIALEMNKFVQQQTSSTMELQDILKIVPLRPPAVYCDRIVELEPGVRGVGIKNVTINEPYFQGMDRSEAYEVPSYVITESLGQVGIITLLSHEANLGKGGVLSRINHFEFHLPVHPGDRLVMEYRVTQMKANFARGLGTAKVDDQIVAEGEFILFWS